MLQGVSLAGTVHMARASRSELLPESLRAVRCPPGPHHAGRAKNGEREVCHDGHRAFDQSETFEESVNVRRLAASDEDGPGVSHRAAL